MLYSKDKDLIDKYKDVLASVGKAYDVDGECDAHDGLDLGVAFSAMKAAVANGTTADIKGVPADFNWKQFAKDCK